MKVIAKSVELWLNIVHYCIYMADYKLHMLTNKLNPFLVLEKIPMVKRNLNEQGKSLKELGNKVWTDRQLGFGIMISGGGLVLIVLLMMFSISMIVNGAFNYSINLSWRQSFVIGSFLSYIICHITVFQKDKYICYFKRFDKKSRLEKRRYGLFSLAFVFVALGLWIYSFRYIPIS